MRKREEGLPFCFGAVVLMLQLQISHPPPSARTFLHTLSIGRISYYTLSLSYTTSCLHTRAEQSHIQQLFNPPLLFFFCFFLSPLFHAFFLSSIPLATRLQSDSQSHFFFPLSCLTHNSSQSCAHAHPARYHCSVRVLCI